MNTWLTFKRYTDGNGNEWWPMLNRIEKQQGAWHGKRSDGAEAFVTMEVSGSAGDEEIARIVEETKAELDSFLNCPCRLSQMAEPGWWKNKTRALQVLCATHQDRLLPRLVSH